jgi:hypothetical protein
MSRIVSVWLPRWPILRFLAAQAGSPLCKPIDPQRPFVLAVDAAGGPRIAALNVAAEREGLSVGDSLADARAKAGMLQVHAADPIADDAALPPGRRAPANAGVTHEPAREVARTYLRTAMLAGRAMAGPRSGRLDSGTSAW